MALHEYMNYWFWLHVDFWLHVELITGKATTIKNSWITVVKVVVNVFKLLPYTKFDQKRMS